MAHIRHRRKDIAEGPISASLFFESSKTRSSSPTRMTSYSRKICTSLLSLVRTTFWLLLTISVVFSTIPMIMCALHVHWPLPSYLGTICQPGFFGNTFSVVNTSPTFSSLVDRVTTLEITSGRYTSIRNFAHFGDGAQVLPEITSLTHGMKDNHWLHGPLSARDVVYKNPPFVISDDQMSVGACWEIEGSAGVLGILLSEPAHISAMSTDNVHPNLVSTTSYARNPRKISLWGMLPNFSIPLPAATELRYAKQFLPDFNPNPRSYVKAKDQFAHLLSIHYDLRDATTNQFFELPKGHWTTHVVFRAVLVEILENWGGDTTCLYRLRVHGRV